MRKNQKKPSRNYGRSNTSSKRKPQGKERVDTHVKDTDLDTTKSGNDPAWYAADPSILRDAASIPFSWPTGASDICNPALWSGVTLAPYSKIPGILTLLTVPSVGTALRATDPINVASQSVYSFVRHANSGHSNYDAPDLMLYILAMANFYSFLVWCQRIYGFALTYDQRNRYLPRELMRTDNVDPDSIINNLANFRFWINTLIAKAASFAVPASMSIFSRMSFMYSGLYIEGTTVKDQVYKFAPDGFYQFNINSGSSLGELIYQQIDRSNLMTVSDIMTMGDTLFNAIWSQEDFGIMSGDILKAYGDNIIKLTAIPEFYTITPSFDPVVLTQMKNAKLLEADPGTIGQNGSGLITQIIQPHTYTTADVTIGGTAFTSGMVTIATGVRLNLFKDWKVLTVDTDNPTPEVVIEATRLIYGYDEYLAELRVGTEFIKRAIVTYDVGQDMEYQQLNVPDTSPNNITVLGRVMQYDRAFHYMPQTWWLNNWASGLTSAEVAQLFDVDNFAILDNQDVIKMHAAATINLLAVPSVGKVL